MVTSNVAVWPLGVAAVVLAVLLGLAVVVHIALRGANSRDRPKILFGLAAVLSAIWGRRS